MVLYEAVHEEAALEVVPPEPLVEDVEDRQESLLGQVGPQLDLPLEPRPRPDLLAALEDRLDELVLGAEMPVERHLRHTGLGDDSIDTDAVDAVAGEELVRGLQDALARVAAA